MVAVSKDEAAARDGARGAQAEQGRRSSTKRAPTRWCRRCCSASPARRSSACASASVDADGTKPGRRPANGRDDPKTRATETRMI